MMLRRKFRELSPRALAHKAGFVAPDAFVRRPSLHRKADECVRYVS